MRNSTLYPVGAAAGTWETFNFEIIDDGGTVTLPIGDGKVLVFYKTLGFSHSSIDDGIAMITKQGQDNGLWETDSSDDSGDGFWDSFFDFLGDLWDAAVDFFTS